MNKSVNTFLLLTLSSSTFAMFCPNGFNDMNIGDSMEQVTKSCGAPDSKKDSKSTPTKAQEWSYYVKPDPSMPGQSQVGLQPGTFKMNISFDSSQKVVNITVNGTSLTTTPVCGVNNAIPAGCSSAPPCNPAVNYGDTMDKVEAACGKPPFVLESAQAGNAPPTASQETQITEFTYNTSPPTILIFENGKLKERK